VIKLVLENGEIMSVLLATPNFALGIEKKLEVTCGIDLNEDSVTFLFLFC
jgi:hypothetical protein